MTTDDLLRFTPSGSPDQARLSIDTARRSAEPINPYLFGKFCEHLGQNIYQGMDAQILANPTFARWIFSAGDDQVNGGMAAEYDPVRIAQGAADRAARLGLPDGDLLAREYLDGLAFGWFRLGTRAEARVSADVGPHGDRAQRLEVLDAAGGQPQGLAQWIYLPLHRTRGYVYRLVARASAPVELEISLAPGDAAGRCGAALAADRVSVDDEWQTVCGTLEIAADAPIDPAGLFRLAVTAAAPANIVIDRLLLYPDDHVGYADPDIIRLLQEARLPLLRWPGGNFVSGYRWQAGVGPADARPTLPNPAWESLEYNLFGTDEFIAYCRTVGCEPMICANAGDGTPAEAAAWVEYCNGSDATPMGKLRAANGHPAPYDVRLWEIGNELDGRHQVSWTTAGGYADRYLRFVRAMKAADPTIRVLACGSEWRIQSEWNTALIEQAAAQLNTITHHALNGGGVNERTDPVALYHSFMGYAGPLGARYRSLLAQMAAAGISDPKVAITELQLFAHYGGAAGIGTDLSPETMPTNQTISEALYVATIIHECIRMAGGVELVTHSATVNHGGGLRKTRERVWANPIHYGHVMLGNLRQHTPLALVLEAPTYDVPESFDNGVMPPLAGVPAIDAVAALSPDGGTVLVSLVHRSALSGPIRLEIDLGDAGAGGQATVTTLAGRTWWDQNSEQDPERIVPRTAQIDVAAGRAAVVLPPYSYTQVAFALGGSR